MGLVFSACSAKECELKRVAFQVPISVDGSSLELTGVYLVINYKEMNKSFDGKLSAEENFVKKQAGFLERGEYVEFNKTAYHSIPQDLFGLLSRRYAKYPARTFMSQFRWCGLDYFLLSPQATEAHPFIVGVFNAEHYQSCLQYFMSPIFQSIGSALGVEGAKPIDAREAECKCAYKVQYFPPPPFNVGDCAEIRFKGEVVRGTRGSGRELHAAKGFHGNCSEKYRCLLDVFMKDHVLADPRFVLDAGKAKIVFFTEGSDTIKFNYYAMLNGRYVGLSRKDTIDSFDFLLSTSELKNYINKVSR